MDYMDGFAIMKEILSMKLDIPVIAIIAYARELDKNTIWEAGSSDY
jgi:CheY-like chemotaxis protein